MRRCKCGGVGAARTASLQIGPRRQPEDGSDGGRIIRTVSKAVASACGGVEGGGGGDASEKWPQSWALIQSTHRSAEEALPMRVRRHRTVPPAA